MSEHNDFYVASLAKKSTVPTLLCGHCSSVLSRERIFANEGEERINIDCNFIGLCSADDCGAINCCDLALQETEEPDPDPTGRVAV